jgi:hypothetical protein
MKSEVRLILIFPFVLFFQQISFTAYGFSAEPEERLESGKPPAFQRYQDTQSNVPVDVYVSQSREKVLKTEFISSPLGMTRIKSVELISSEGTVYGPRTTFEISEQAAKNLGLLQPVFVPEKKVSKSTKAKVGSALLGGAFTALTGLAGSSKSTYSTGGHYAAKKSSSVLPAVGIAGGLTPALVSGSARKSKDAQEKGEWVYPPTAGTGIFSSVAEFDIPVVADESKPWQLKATMQYPDGKESVYSFVLFPAGIPAGGRPPEGPPAEKTIWDDLRLTGPSSKLL